MSVKGHVFRARQQQSALWMNKEDLWCSVLTVVCCHWVQNEVSRPQHPVVPSDTVGTPIIPSVTRLLWSRSGSFAPTPVNHCSCCPPWTWHLSGQVYTTTSAVKMFPWQRSVYSPGEGEGVCDSITCPCFPLSAGLSDKYQVLLTVIAWDKIWRLTGSCCFNELSGAAGSCLPGSHTISGVAGSFCVWRNLESRCRSRISPLPLTPNPFHPLLVILHVYSLYILKLLPVF